MQYMFRLEHATPPQDLPPGGTLKLHVVWQFANDKETVVDPLAFDWSVLPSRGEKVEPLIVRDTPPADLPRTRLAEKHGYYGLNVNSGCSFMPLWAAAGAEWLRANQFEWRKVEAQPGQFDFSSADKTVDAAERMGMQTFAVIHRTPAWAARHGSSTDPPKDLSVWGRYIETLVHRYRERVHVWEIWNEPDIDEFWSGSAQDYVDLLRTAYAAAKRADPKCLVMSAGPDGPGENFLQQIVQLGAANYCDLIGFHPYGALPEGPEKRMRAVWRILNFYHVKKPVWATEVGWQAGGWNGGWNVGNEEAKARCLTEGFQRLRPWAEVVCWYVDIEPNHVFGLAEPRGTHGFELNPAYFAFQRAAGSQKHSLPVRVELPASVRAPAGKSTILRGRITNTGQRPLTLTAEVVGLAPEQLRLALKPDPLAGGQSRELELAVAPPPYLRAGKNALLVAFFSEQQLVGKAWLTLDVANDEPFRDFTLSEGWVQRVDVNGKDVAAAFPQDRFALAPGQAFRQSLTLENVGAADDTFVLTLEGPAAAWVAAPMKTKEIRVPAGKKTWIPLEVRIPMDASPGTHALRAIAASRTYPDLRRQCIIDVNIGATQ
jgi:hypothetical protein